MDYVLLKKRKALDSQEYIYPFQLWMSSQWTGSFNALLSLVLNESNKGLKITYLQLMPSSFFTCQCCGFLHSTSSTEKCVLWHVKTARNCNSMQTVFWVHFGILWNLLFICFTQQLKKSSVAVIFFSFLVVDIFYLLLSLFFVVKHLCPRAVLAWIPSGF